MTEEMLVEQDAKKRKRAEKNGNLIEGDSFLLEGDGPLSHLCPVCSISSICGRAPEV